MVIPSRKRSLRVDLPPLLRFSLSSNIDDGIFYDGSVCVRAMRSAISPAISPAIRLIIRTDLRLFPFVSYLLS